MTHFIQLAQLPRPQTRLIKRSFVVNHRITVSNRPLNQANHLIAVHCTPFVIHLISDGKLQSIIRLPSPPINAVFSDQTIKSSTDASDRSTKQSTSLHLLVLCNDSRVYRYAIGQSINQSNDWFERRAMLPNNTDITAKPASTINRATEQSEHPAVMIDESIEQSINQSVSQSNTNNRKRARDEATQSITPMVDHVQLIDILSCEKTTKQSNSINQSIRHANNQSQHSSAQLLRISENTSLFISDLGMMIIDDRAGTEPTWAAFDNQSNEQSNDRSNNQWNDDSNDQSTLHTPITTAFEFVFSGSSYSSAVSLPSISMQFIKNLIDQSTNQTNNQLITQLEALQTSASISCRFFMAGDSCGRLLIVHYDRSRHKAFKYVLTEPIHLKTLSIQSIKQSINQSIDSSASIVALHYLRTPLSTLPQSQPVNEMSQSQLSRPFTKHLKNQSINQSVQSISCVIAIASNGTSRVWRMADEAAERSDVCCIQFDPDRLVDSLDSSYHSDEQSIIKSVFRDGDQLLMSIRPSHPVNKLLDQSKLVVIDLAPTSIFDQPFVLIARPINLPIRIVSFDVHPIVGLSSIGQLVSIPSMPSNSVSNDQHQSNNQSQHQSNYQSMNSINSIPVSRVRGVGRCSLIDDSRALQMQLRSIDRLVENRRQLGESNARCDQNIATINTIMMFEKLMAQYHQSIDQTIKQSNNQWIAQGPLSVHVFPTSVSAALRLAPIRVVLTNRSALPLSVPANMTTFVIELDLIYLPSIHQSINQSTIRSRRTFSWMLPTDVLSPTQSVEQIMYLPVVDQPLLYQCVGHVSLQYAISQQGDANSDPSFDMYNQSASHARLSIGTFTIEATEWCKQSTHANGVFTLSTRSTNQLLLAHPVDNTRPHQPINQSVNQSSTSDVQIIFLSAVTRLPATIDSVTVSNSMLSAITHTRLTKPGDKSKVATTTFQFPSDPSFVLTPCSLSLPLDIQPVTVPMITGSFLPSHNLVSNDHYTLYAAAHRRISIAVLDFLTRPLPLKAAESKSAILAYVTWMQQSITISDVGQSDVKLVKGASLTLKDVLTILIDQFIMPRSTRRRQLLTDIRSLQKQVTLPNEAHDVSLANQIDLYADAARRVLALYKSSRRTTSSDGTMSNILVL